ncbi:type II toxin-antitoxin system RelE/ParE family toxin [Shinella sp. BYT-45]|uniref:type II toxin-antitoxin system RelE/ParE family toxin n=1 Tax=Shinella sp. BYT-45 TaxID=3377377 RepID=UPI00397F25F4
MKTIVLPSARADIIRQFGYFIEIGQKQVADRFLAATRTAVEHISHTPHAGSPRAMKNRRLAGLRTWSIEGFDDLKIYYLVSADELAIVRILHGRRDIERILEQ